MWRWCVILQAALKWSTQKFNQNTCAIYCEGNIKDFPRSKGSRMRWPIYSGHWRFMLFDVSKKSFCVVLKWNAPVHVRNILLLYITMKYKHRYSYIALYCKKTSWKCIFIDVRNYVKYFEGSPTWFKRNLLSFVCCMNASFYL